MLTDMNCLFRVLEGTESFETWVVGNLVGSLNYGFGR